MDWNSYFYAAAGVLLASLLLWILLSLRKNRSARWFKPFHIFILGIFISSVFLFLPLYSRVYGDSAGRHYVITASIVQALQLFTLNGERDALRFCYNDPPVQPGLVYAWLLSAEYLLAPFMAAGFIASFFKNFTASIAYGLRFFFPKYIFSELNEKSLALAESIRKTHRFVTIVFSGFREPDSKSESELLNGAGSIRAICFKKSFTETHFGFHLWFQRLFLFAISENETENVTQAVEMIPKYRRYKADLYVFSTQIEGEMILEAQKDKGRLTVHRINAVQTLIYQELLRQAIKDYNNRNASSSKEVNTSQHVSGNQKSVPSLSEMNDTIYSRSIALNGQNSKNPVSISAAVLGLGQYGTEMVKALSWYCQMDGYRLKIHAFDQDEKARRKFAAACPELMDEKHNGKDIKGDAFCEISIHDHVSIETDQFFQQIENIKELSYVLVCLGSDELNLRTAIALRTRLARKFGAKNPDQLPLIQTVVYNSDYIRYLDKMRDENDKPYGISLIGDLKSMYSEAAVLHSDLELLGFIWHNETWANGEPDPMKKYWDHEYHYRSSCARVIHSILLETYAKQGSQNGCDTEKLKKIEHVRWNAYMRSEGYVYSGSTDKGSRNRMGKTHNDLTVYHDVHNNEKEKDKSLTDLMIISKDTIKPTSSAANKYKSELKKIGRNLQDWI